MPFLATYLTYREHSGDVPKYRAARRQEEAVRKSAFTNKTLSPEELRLAKQRGEILKRTIDALDEYAQTRTEDVESVTQTVLGESTSLLTAAGVAIGKLYQATDSGKNLTSKLASKMGKYATAAPNVIPGVSGLIFAILSSIPLLHSLTTIEIQTPRIARFEALKKEFSNPNEFAILTDEQIKQAQKNAQNITVSEPKPTDKSVLTSLNIFSQFKSYMNLLAKRAVYKNEKANFDRIQNIKYNNAKNMKITDLDRQKAEETKEIIQRLVNKIDLESQDYIERVFKILDVFAVCLFGFGVVGYWALEKVMGLAKIKDGAFKKYAPVLASLAGVILLNSKIAEYRNNTIRISRHKQLNSMLDDPTNFLKTPASKGQAQEEKSKEKKGVFTFLKEYKKDLAGYEKYAKEKILADKKYRMAVNQLKLTPEQLKEAKLTRTNIFKMINKADDNRRKYEEKFDVLMTMLATPLGLCAATLGNAFGWILYKAKNAPKKQMPLYSIIGTAAGLVPAIAIEVTTTMAVRRAARVAYMKAHQDLGQSDMYLDYSNVRGVENPFLKLAFKNK